ncbi:hypothetical protein EI94DRAFT_195259 [Lactarius quietus]|nr:hypothetical protein EI94DRAFT_195259 [Lactarius quietus]
MQEIKKMNRMIAFQYNEKTSSSPHGHNQRFEVVYFPNLEDPTSEPHNLPLLTSRPSIAGLTEAQVVAYYHGYYPGENAQRVDRRSLVHKAIGVRLMIDDCVLRP